MFKKIRGGLKVAGVCVLVMIFFGYVDSEGFAPTKAITVFIGVFVIHEVLEFLKNKFVK